jgi:hypothetical protein
MATDFNALHEQLLQHARNNNFRSIITMTDLKEEFDWKCFTTEQSPYIFKFEPTDLDDQKFECVIKAKPGDPDVTFNLGIVTNMRFKNNENRLEFMVMLFCASHGDLVLELLNLTTWATRSGKISLQ